MTERSTGHDGFTLIETLMALFVISILTVSGASMLLTTLQAGRQVQERGDALAELQVAHAFLRDDFAAAVVRETEPPNSLDSASVFRGSEGGATGDLVAFTRGGWTNPGGFEARSDLQRIEYSFENGALLRRSWARPDAARATPVVEQVILDELERVDMRYLGGQDWSDVWLSVSSVPEIGLPDAIEVSLVFSRDDRIVARFITGGAR